MKPKHLYFLLIFAFGCNTLPVEPETSPVNNCPSLKINGVYEIFCGSIEPGVNSQLETTELLYIHFETDSIFRNSENYKASSLAFANIIPETDDYESEFKFFQSLFLLMKPGSLHNFNLGELGGFAIELWDNSGNYYSSELGPQTNNAQIYIDSFRTSIERPEFNQVDSFMEIWLYSTAPVVLWNADQTMSIEVSVERIYYPIYFNMF